MNKKVLFIIPFASILLSSCGLGLKEIYRGDAYASGVFKKDYYKDWDAKIDLSNPNNNILAEEYYELDKDRDYVFTRYSDDNFTLCDYDAKKIVDDHYALSYEDDYYSGDKDYYLNKGYGPTRKLSRIDESFKYGYISKLFDGQMFCHARYQYARVQINEDGFGKLFKKECPSLNNTYFALNFKASYDYTKYGKYDFNFDGVIEDEENCQSLPHEGSTVTSGVNLKVSFYCKQDNGYIKKTFAYKLDNIPTNASENPGIYTFFGFRFANYDVKRVAGFSIAYDFDRTNKKDNPALGLKDKDGNVYELDHSLLLYEAFLPNTNWN